MPLLYEIERLDTHCQGMHILGRANIELEIASIMPWQSPTEKKGSRPGPCEKYADIPSGVTS